MWAGSAGLAHLGAASSRYEVSPDQAGRLAGASSNMMWPKPPAHGTESVLQGWDSSSPLSHSHRA